MDGKSYLACLWPGLPDLWHRGRLSALPAALAFAFALNFLLIARFIYPEWLAPLLVRIACWVAFAVWVYLVVRAVKELPTLINPRAASASPDRFSEAHRHYLQGHWRESEALLTECLGIESRDPPAMLLLAGVYRHTERLEAAENILQELERLEAAEPWWLECTAERARLTRFQNVEAEKSKDNPNTEEPEAGGANPEPTPSPEETIPQEKASSQLAADAADALITAGLTADSVDENFPSGTP